MTEPLKVGVVGRDGRMGAAALDWIRAEAGLELVGAVGRGDGWEALDGASVALDVTRAGLGALHGERLLRRGIRPLIGTSGVTPYEAAALHELAIECGLGGAVVPNFSAGFLALSRAVSASRGLLPSARVVEAHHAQKVDAPSGTAIQLAEQLDVDPDKVTSLRMDGLLAVHEVRLLGADDLVTLRHETLGLGGFREGLIAGLWYAFSACGVAYGLAEVMSGTCKVQPQA